jgi:uncharacterized protein YlxW (UPF0749 family)
MIGLLMGAYRIPAIIAGIVMLITTFYGWLVIHDHNVRETVTAEYNAKQEELLAQKKAEFDKQVAELQTTADNLKKSLKDSQDITDAQIENISKGIVSIDRNKLAPSYYKELMKSMQKNFGETK